MSGMRVIEKNRPPEQAFTLSLRFTLVLDLSAVVAVWMMDEYTE